MAERTELPTQTHANDSRATDGSSARAVSVPTNGKVIVSEDQNAPVTFADSVRAKFAGRENVRPEEVAAALQLPNGKAVRGFLRMTFPRPVELKGSTWLLTNDQVLQTVEAFLAKRADASPNADAK